MADRALPDLVGRTRLDNRQLKKGATEAKTEIAGIGKGAQGASNVIQGAFGKASASLTSRLGPASGAAQKALDGIGGSALKSGNLIGSAIGGGALAAAAGIGALVASGVGKFTELAGKVRDFQRVSGASADTSSRFVAVLDDMGVNADAGAKAISKLLRGLDTGAIQKFGVEVAKTKDGNVDAVPTLANLADAYRKLQDPAQKAELRFAALGKQGDTLIPILEKGGARLREFFKNVPKGELLSQKDLDNAEEFRLAMDRLGDSVENIQRNAGRGVVPWLSDAANGIALIAEKADEASPTVKTFLGGIVDALPVVGPIKQVGDLLGFVGEKSKDVAGAQDAMAREMQETAVQADAEARALDRLFLAQIASVDSALGLKSAELSYRDALIGVKDKQDALNLAIQQHGPRSAEAQGATRDLEKAQLDAETSASRQASAIVGLAKDTAIAAGEEYGAEQQTIAFKDALRAAADQASGPVKDALLRLADTYLPPVAKTHEIAVELVGEEKVKADLREIGRLINIGNAAIGLPGVPLPPGRMAGGPVIGGRPYIVGERRPELFIPNVSGRIVPRVPTGRASAAGVVAGGDTVHLTVHLPNYLGDKRAVANELAGEISTALNNHRVTRSA